MAIRERTAPPHPHLVRLLLTDEERAALETVARLRGWSLSDVLRAGLRTVASGDTLAVVRGPA
jgi:hypothetical protein